MEVTLSWQIFSTGISALVGLGLAAVYDIFRVTRILFGTGKYVMYIQDIIYGIFAAFATFLLALALNDGQVRFYIIGGEVLGMAVYFSTLGRVTVRLAKWVHRICQKFILWMKRRVFTPFAAFWEKKRTAMAQKRAENEKKHKKSEGNTTNPLKPAHNMVYNQIKHFFMGSSKSPKGGVIQHETASAAANRKKSGQEKTQM